MDAVAVRKDLDNYLRYQTCHDRAYQRAAAELAKRRKDRDLRERGFVRQQHAEAQEKRHEQVHELATQERFFRVATAAMKMEREKARYERECGRLVAPQTGQMAA